MSDFPDGVGVAFRATRLAPPTPWTGLVGGQVIGLVPPAIQTARLRRDEEQPVSTQEDVQPPLSDADLPGFKKETRDLILHAVNDLGTVYRLASNKVLLFPPDHNEAPYSVGVHVDGRRLANLEAWVHRHLDPKDAPPDPVVVAAIETAAAHPGTGWDPYVEDRSGQVSEFFETNGAVIRCKMCVGTPTEYYTSEIRGLGGHVRMCHRDRANLHTPEALAKALDTKRFNRLHGQVVQAVDILCQAVGYDPVRIEELEAQVQRLTKERDDALARLELLYDTFREVRKA